MLEVFNDEYFMKEALKEAMCAEEEGEIPVGAVIVCNEKVIARSHNQTEILKDVTAHAEMVAITAASSSIGSKYLNDCTMYVTLEPCIMCAGAIRWAQLGRLVYGASDDERGFMRFGKMLLHPKTKLEYGVLTNPCAAILKNFFKKTRIGNS